MSKRSQKWTVTFTIVDRPDFKTCECFLTEREVREELRTCFTMLSAGLSIGRIRVKEAPTK
jgi:hypothetical protein